MLHYWFAGRSAPGRPRLHRYEHDARVRILNAHSSPDSGADANSETDRDANGQADSDTGADSHREANGHADGATHSDPDRARDSHPVAGCLSVGKWFRLCLCLYIGFELRLGEREPDTSGHTGADRRGDLLHAVPQ